MKKQVQKLIMIISLFAVPVVTNAQTTLFLEDFASGSLPAGWTNDSLGFPAATLWEFNTPSSNPFNRIITGAGFDTSYAIFDGDRDGTDDMIPDYASLTTSSIDISTATIALFLEMDEQFRQYMFTIPLSTRRIEYSTDNGSTWASLVFSTAQLGNLTAVHTSYDLSSLIGSSNVNIRFTYTGDFHYWWAIDNVQLITSCSSAPNAGAVVATSDSVSCIGEVDTLSLSGADAGILITYQWQSSPDNSTWTDIPGAVSATVIVGPTAATYYQCNVTCTGLTSASTSVLVTLGSSTICYCTPVHAFSCSGSTGAITNVEMVGTTLNNTSGCDQLTDSGYTLWNVSANTVANLMRNTSYDINVTTDDDNIISVWIDLNENGRFEPGEWKQVCTTSVAGVANLVSFPIPPGATVGLTMMRIRACVSANTNDSLSACISFGSGESEDYVVGIEFNVGVHDMTLIDGNGIYPNPTSGKLTVFLRENFAGAVVQLYDVIGNLMQSSVVENSLRTDLDISSLSDGIYFVKIRSNNDTVTQKIILNK